MIPIVAPEMVQVLKMQQTGPCIYTQKVSLNHPPTQPPSPHQRKENLGGRKTKKKQEEGRSENQKKGKQAHTNRPIKHTHTHTHTQTGRVSCFV